MFFCCFFFLLIDSTALLAAHTVRLRSNSQRFHTNTEQLSQADGWSSCRRFFRNFPSSLSRIRVTASWPPASSRICIVCSFFFLADLASCLLKRDFVCAQISHLCAAEIWWLCVLFHYYFGCFQRSQNAGKILLSPPSLQITCFVSHIYRFVSHHPDSRARIYSSSVKWRKHIL